MALLYIEGTTNPSPDSEKADTEDIPEGDLVVRTSGGGCVLADAASHDHVSGIALNFEAGDQIASHPFDYEAGIDDFVYQPAANKDSDDMFPSEDDRVPISGQGDNDHVVPATIDDNGTDPAASVSRNDVVGVAAVTGGKGRIVEEGYTDDAGTTYGRSDTGDFLALGRVERVVDANNDTMFGRRVVVRRDKSL